MQANYIFRKHLLLSFCMLLLMGRHLNAQTIEQRSEITKDYSIEAFNEVSNTFKKEFVAKELKVENYLRQHQMERSMIDENGTYYFIHSIDQQNNPVYWQTYNDEGVQTINAFHLYSNGSLGLNLSGSNLEAGIWDGGNVLDTHTDVIGRINLGETSNENKGHASHVGGTIIGNGSTIASTAGIAPQATLKSYQFNGDNNEMLSEAFAGMLISNHSYGPASRSSSSGVIVYPRSDLGKYTSGSSEFDTVTSIAPYYLPVVSAGNDQNDVLNPSDSGYDLLKGSAVSKNALVVGAVDTVFPYVDNTSVMMSDFSSWGPADDGRIKPDIVAKGVQVLSLSGSSNTGYVVRSGTSMSAPMVTGGILLLQELHHNIFSRYMKSASVRGLVSLTSQEAGLNPGPDYRFGWGLLDLKAAAELIVDTNGSAQLSELSLTQNSTYTSTVTSSQQVLKVGIAWTERPGSINSGVEDDTTPVLVNDLDLKLTDSSGNDFFPWKLNPSTFTAAAIKGDNSVDNIEIVEIIAPAGTYQISVSHKGTSIAGGRQDFSLIIQGADPGTLSVTTSEINEFKLYPNPATNQVTISLGNQQNNKEISIDVYDILGKQILSNTYENSGNFEQSIDVSQFNSGIYLVRVGNGKTYDTRKLIVK
jgi:serine protease AprX